VLVHHLLQEGEHPSDDVAYVMHRTDFAPGLPGMQNLTVYAIGFDAMTGPLVSVDIRGRDLRIRPDTGELEAVSGQTQFGRNCDDWGNWFGGNNSNPVWHYVLEDRYLRRNPGMIPPDPRKHVPDQPGSAPVYPISRTLQRDRLWVDPFFGDLALAFRLQRPPSGFDLLRIRA